VHTTDFTTSPANNFKVVVNTLFFAAHMLLFNLHHSIFTPQYLSIILATLNLILSFEINFVSNWFLLVLLKNNLKQIKFAGGRGGRAV
jgi:hypothetical protein